jgi:glycosyltransferase involved in cell wall biosynthesis
MRSPLVSVLMTVHEGERFLSEAVDSILGQTLEDLELIAVDDGSTDGSASILAQRARSDARMSVHRHSKNLGIVAARNTAAGLARGEFVAVMDQDDVSLPERLAAEVEFLRARPKIGMVGSAVQVIDSTGRRGRIKLFPTHPAMVAWLMLFANTLANPTTMVRRRIGDQLGWYAAEDVGGTEDLGFFMRARRVTQVANLPEVLLLYRVWEASTTSTAWALQEQQATRIVREAMQEFGISEATLDQAHALRGLSTERYPAAPDMIERLGRLIDAMSSRFIQQPWLEARDRAAVRRDAAVKLWLLSALAARRAPGMAAGLAATATRISPTSLVRFAAKAARRVLAG